MKFNWNFQRSGGLRKNPFHGGGKDNLWNYTIPDGWEGDERVVVVPYTLRSTIFPEIGF